MAHSFQMDPQATGNGLTAAGQSRSQAVGSGIPALPVGNYISGYSTAATAVLSTLRLELAATIGSGLANTANSVTSTETTERTNQISVST